MAEGGVVPYEHSGPSGFVRVSPGWRNFGGGSVRVGGRPAVPMRPKAALSRPSASGTPPESLYNPEHKWAQETAQSRLGRTEDEGKRTQQQIEDDYYRNLSRIQEREGFRRTDAAKALAAVKRSFGALGTRQEEQANKAGVLQGGALIQSAAKRAANQGRTEGEQGEALQRGLTSDREAREALAQESGPAAVQGLDWAHLIGSGAGRRIENLAQHIKGLREEGVQFGEQTEEGEGKEAGEAGWEPTAESSKALLAGAKLAGKSPAAAFPAKAAVQRYLNRRSGRMETRQQLRAYRSRRR